MKPTVGRRGILQNEAKVLHSLKRTQGGQLLSRTLGGNFQSSLPDRARLSCIDFTIGLIRFRGWCRISAGNDWVEVIDLVSDSGSLIREGGFGLDLPAGAVPFNRLCEHAESIRQTKNLSIEHFACRYLVVDDIWIPLGESLLIEMSPIWNRLIDGFSNHDPGSAVTSNDVHPGTCSIRAVRSLRSYSAFQNGQGVA